MIYQLSREELGPARQAIEMGHYLHRWPDPRTSMEAYAVTLPHHPEQHVGYITIGRPEATRCGTWYGSYEDQLAGRCEVTRWQVVNLSRMWLNPIVQPGGTLHSPNHLPGYIDRRGIFRSTLASQALRTVAEHIRLSYLVARPPCFLNEPYQLRYLLSYCDTRTHRGVIYREAGFELYRRNGGPSRTIDTYRMPLAPLTADQDEQIRQSSRQNPRAQRYRAQRTQLLLELFNSPASLAL